MGNNNCSAVPHGDTDLDGLGSGNSSSAPQILAKVKSEETDDGYGEPVAQGQEEGEKSGIPDFSVLSRTPHEHRNLWKVSNSKSETRAGGVYRGI